MDSRTICTLLWSQLSATRGDQQRVRVAGLLLVREPEAHGQTRSRRRPEAIACTRVGRPPCWITQSPSDPTRTAANSRRGSVVRTCVTSGFLVILSTDRKVGQGFVAPFDGCCLLTRRITWARPSLVRCQVPSAHTSTKPAIRAHPNTSLSAGTCAPLLTRNKITWPMRLLRHRTIEPIGDGIRANLAYPTI
jgi:hypothetical protein